jgi:hypothetical protein
MGRVDERDRQAGERMADDDVGRRDQGRVVLERRPGIVTGQVDRLDSMAADVQLRGQVLPAPRAVPGAVDE